MTTTLTRRIERLERALSPATSGPCLIMASDANAAARRVAQLKSEFGEQLPRTLFVIMLTNRKDQGQ